MGMDVYVGPLSRYLLQDWMTIAQQVGQANGYDVQVLRPNEPAPSDPAHVESIVSTWQLELLEALGTGGTPWPDHPTLPYWTDKPDWDGYGGLVLLAAYAECPHLAPGAGADNADDPREFHKSAAYEAATQAPKRFPSLLHGTQWWLPIDSGNRAFRATGPAGQMVMMAPVSKLLSELRDLSHELNLTNIDERDAIRHAGPPPTSADVATCGRFGLAVLLPLVAKAYLEKQPLILDV